MPASVFEEIEPDLRAFGGRVADDVLELHRECEANPPRLEQFDAWGKRVDRLVTCDAWKRMKTISAEEGLVAIAYENKYGAASRLYQIAKSILFSPSSGLYSCPLSMTDGAAKIIGASEGMSPGGTNLKSAFERLTSRDPETFWTSGQWMTERGGWQRRAGYMVSLDHLDCTGSKTKKVKDRRAEKREKKEKSEKPSDDWHAQLIEKKLERKFTKMKENKKPPS